MDLIDGFVLAGGQSRRMGQNKATLLLGGRSLIDRASEALFPIANTVHAVGNITGEVTSLPIIQDHPTKGNTRGAMVGLYTALVNAKTGVGSRTCLRPAVCYRRIDDSHRRNFAAS
ncbi:MAG: NTP transferase domain-containing protein [Acidobacteria bacterium]|nr:NTP transferase domain-containing protein [Acidobacteriota bacterium]